MLVFTVPLIAIVTSLAMFSYSAVAHGFGVKSPVRSLTVLDQPGRTAVTIARVALFSGITRSEGLQFSPDAAVYPIWPNDNAFEGGTIELSKAPSVLRVAGCRTNARRQFSRSLRGGRSAAASARSEDPQQGDIAANSGLDSDIEAIIVAGPDGRLYFGTDLPANGSIQLRRTTGEDAREFATLLRRHPLEAEEEVVIDEKNPLFEYMVNKGEQINLQRESRRDDAHGVAETSCASPRTSRSPAIRHSTGIRISRFRSPIRAYEEWASARQARAFPTTSCTATTECSNWRKSTHGPEATGASSEDGRNAVIDVRGLHRYFGRLKAVNNVSFRVYRGQVMGFIGPNGAGKTTAMRILVDARRADGRRRVRLRLFGHRRPRQGPPHSGVHARQLRPLLQHERGRVSRLLTRGPTGSAEPKRRDAVERVLVVHRAAQAGRKADRHALEGHVAAARARPHADSRPRRARSSTSRRPGSIRGPASSCAS